jgi:hypothetical protein
VNLLPYDLHYAVKDAVANCAGHIKPGQSALLTQVPLVKYVFLPTASAGLSVTEGCIVHAVAAIFSLVFCLFHLVTV